MLVTRSVPPLRLATRHTARLKHTFNHGETLLWSETCWAKHSCTQARLCVSARITALHVLHVGAAVSLVHRGDIDTPQHSTQLDHGSTNTLENQIKTPNSPEGTRSVRSLTITGSSRLCSSRTHTPQRRSPRADTHTQQRTCQQAHASPTARPDQNLSAAKPSLLSKFCSNSGQGPEFEWHLRT